MTLLKGLAPVLAALLLLPAPASAGLFAPGAPGELLVGFRGGVDVALLEALGASAPRTLASIGVAQVWSPDVPGLKKALTHAPGIVFVESDDPLRLAGSWDGLAYSASSWDASSWDASSWDASSWDASSWDASSWDASSWDASSWDASSWDGGLVGMDPRFPEQWGLGAARFPDAWEIERGHGRIPLCVVDTGVDASHPDLRPHLMHAGGTYGVNAMAGGRGGATDDVGHGTHVAGIAGAIAGNASGIAGAAREPILAVKVMDAKGGRESDLAAGILACVDAGTRVISLSLHIDRHSPTVQRAIERAQAAGLLVVAAAGNDGAATVRYPAAYPGVLAVGSVGADGKTSPFSNRGARLDLVAPGDHIVSTFPGNGYRVGSGTSQATPFVAAAAALAWERDPSASAADVRALLLDHARDLGLTGRDDLTGHGALHAGAAVAAAG